VAVNIMGLVVYSMASAETYLRTKWHLDSSSRLAIIDIGRKVGGVAAPLSMGRAGSPSNTISPGPRPTSLPSGTLIHPTIWPQHTNVTDRHTDRTDNGPVAYGETLPFNGRPKRREINISYNAAWGGILECNERRPM